VLVAGGSTQAAGALARREAQRIHVARGEVRTDAAGMFLPRTLARAVRVGSEAWVIGGAQSELPGSPGLDSFERYDARAEGFGAPGRLLVARVLPGVVRLRDGSVLVAGGAREVGGSGLDTLERIRVDGTSEALPFTLPFPAPAPQLFVRDDGLVWLLADDAGSLRLALLDPRGSDVEAFELGLASAPAASLPGGGLALIETSAGVTTGVLQLISPSGDTLVLDDWLTSFAGLRDARVESLRDGRIVLTGDSSQGPTARVIDVGRREVRVRRVPSLPIALGLRDDGSLAALGARALFVLREDARTAYDNPGGNLLADDGPLALDTAQHWRREGLSLIAMVPRARFELPSLRYANVRIELRATGEGELVLRRDDGRERTLRVSDASAGPLLCEVPSEGLVSFTREGDRVTVRATGDRTCTLEGMTGPLAIGFRALAQGTRLDELTITRE
jgi:hypothetical protein